MKLSATRFRCKSQNCQETGHAWRSWRKQLTSSRWQLNSVNKSLSGVKSDDGWFQAFFSKELASIYKCLAAVLIQQNRNEEALLKCDQGRRRASAQLLTDKHKKWEEEQEMEPIDHPRKLALKKTTTIIFYAILPVLKSGTNEEGEPQAAFVLDWRLCIWVVQPELG